MRELARFVALCCAEAWWQIQCDLPMMLDVPLDRHPAMSREYWEVWYRCGPDSYEFERRGFRKGDRIWASE